MLTLSQVSNATARRVRRNNEIHERVDITSVTRINRPLYRVDFGGSQFVSIIARTPRVTRRAQITAATLSAALSVEPNRSHSRATSTNHAL